jgi:hypothetical protein
MVYKTLKFSSEHLVAITSGKKTATWRIFDDKNIAPEDNLIFINKSTGQEFAQAKVISIKEVKLKDLTEEDQQGHEKFTSNQEMYETYSKYYRCSVNGHTTVKIIHFELMSI